MLAGAAIVALAALIAGCGGDYPQSTLHPTADFGSEIDRLYRTIVWWALGVFVVVEAALFVAILRFRDRPGAGEPKQVHGSTLLEISWTLAPAVVLIFIAVPTIRTIFRTEGTPPADAMEVEVVGHQWWWEFRYPALGITTANELHVPAGRPVALAMTSDDVIHSFWAPKLGGKRDVMPGRTTRIVFTPDSVGVFFGQCAEFCGESHANMRMRVVVDDTVGFAAWAERQGMPADTAILGPAERRGLQAYRTKGCMACHAVEGVSAGVIGPDLTHVGSRSTIAAGILPNTIEGLSRWIRDPEAEKPGSLMPKMPMTEEELADLAAFLRSLN
jgi:cytochrome c oxidase subunit 2